MSRRGSAQLLLLSFRPRRVLGWTIGVTATAALLAGVLQGTRDFPLLTQTGLAQMLRQSAWERALAELPQHSPWPWVETSSDATSSVPRLGLSASVVKAAAPLDGAEKVLKVESAPAKDPHLAELGEVSIGDRIIVTTADGASTVYRVTGRKVVDPHLAAAEPEAADKNPARCSPLDSLLAGSLQLIIQAGKADQPAPPKLHPEQKL